ncbi:MAG: class I SAM-dependent methyltransferase [Desulforhopalus sp.]
MSYSSGPRFHFGRNWKRYAKTVGEEQIKAAMESLTSSFEFHNFSNLRILDAGCGSGLFSLAACRLAANEIVSFDYDSHSVECTRDLKQRFGPFYNWSIMQGDVLNQTFLNDLGLFDIVYSWGVLHHTGNMWQGLENLSSLVKPGGYLFISIYNDQGWISRVWRMIKKIYNQSPKIIQTLMAAIWYFVVVSVRIFSGIWHRKPPRSWFTGSERGMNLWYDVVDWIGGYPFETSSVKDLQIFLENRNFSLTKTHTKSGSGCNELVLKNMQKD